VKPRQLEGPEPAGAVAPWRWGKGEKLLNISTNFSTSITVGMAGL
jgi:hypothetical protein